MAKADDVCSVVFTQHYLLFVKVMNTFRMYRNGLSDDYFLSAVVE